MPLRLPASKPCLAAAFLAALLATGCVRQVQHSLVSATRQSRTIIDSAQLEQASHKPPVPASEVPPPQPTAALESTARHTGPVDLGLADVRASVLTNSLDLQVTLVDPARARERINQERWQFEATFVGAVNRNFVAQSPNSVSSTTNALASFAGVPNFVVDNVAAGVDVPLTSGGTVEVGYGQSRFDNGSSAFPIFDANPRLGIEQPLLRGAGFDIATADLQISQLNGGAVDARTKLSAIQALADVERQYWRVWGAHRSLDVARNQVQLAEEQLRNAKRLVEAGVWSNVETLRSESGLFARVEILYSAQTERLISERELKRVMQRPDLPVDDPTPLLIRSEPNLLGLEFNRPELTGKGLANRAELLELEMLLAAETVRLKQSRNQIRPELNVLASTTLLGTDTSGERAREQAGTGDFASWFAGVTFEAPLAGNQSARAAYRQVELTRAQIAIMKQRQELVIRKEVNDAIDRFEQNWQRILAARQSVAAAQRTFAAETRLFQLGQRTSDLVLQAAQQLGLAQLREIQAVVDFQYARIELAVATGTMLGYGHVEWQAFPPSRGPLEPDWNRRDGWRHQEPCRRQ